MGFSLKKVANLGGKALGSSIGAFFGGPAGAAAGYSGSNAILGAVGLGDDDLAAEQSLEYQKKMADYAYNQNLQMWNLNNAYNDPAAQMERLKAAGLNANLVYGGGNVTGNTSGGTPEYSYSASPYENKSVQRAQLALAMEEHQQRITNQAIENELARERIGLATREADRQDKLADAQIKAYAANLGLTDARINDINLKDRRTPHEKTEDYFVDLGTRLADKIVGNRSASDSFKKAQSRQRKIVTDFTTGKKRLVVY